jgi:hypothetical protein
MKWKLHRQDNYEVELHRQDNRVRQSQASEPEVSAKMHWAWSKGAGLRRSGIGWNAMPEA